LRDGHFFYYDKPRTEKVGTGLNGAKLRHRKHYST